MKKTLVLAVMAGLAAGGVARADGVDVIQARQTGMDLLAGTFGGINATVAGNGDIKKLEGAGNAIRKWGALMPSLFPAGSDKGTTKAAPEIWSDHAGFVKAALALSSAGEAVAAAAKAGDATALAAAIKTTADACGACHKTYRLK